MLDVNVCPECGGRKIPRAKRCRACYKRPDGDLVRSLLKTRGIEPRHATVYDFCKCGTLKKKVAKLCQECYVVEKRTYVVVRRAHTVSACITEKSTRKRRTVKPYRYLLIEGEMEHRLVMEKELGRPLESDEHVHHVNENKHDNRPENLFVCSRSYHSQLHSDKGRHSVFGRALIFKSFGYI